MGLDSGIMQRLRGAFPSSTSAEVGAALAIVPAEQLGSTDSNVGPIRVGNEVVHIPYRIYVPEPPIEALDSLDERAKTALECLYTRHHNGHLREKYLRAVIASPVEWVPPFVLQLLGEYVIEIQRFIGSSVAYLRQESYARFIADNPVFMELTKQRVISYWDCYHRGASTKLRDFVGFRVLEELGCGGRPTPRCSRQTARNE